MATALIPIIAGIAGGLLNRGQKTEQTQNSTSNTNQTQNTAQNASTAPVYDPYQLQMRNFLISQFYNRSNPGYINNLVNTSLNNGVNAINDSAAPNRLALQNALAQRGLSYSGTAGTALGNAEANRIGQITQLQAQRPLLQDQLQNQNLTSFSDYLSRLPVGQSSSSTGYNNATGTTNTTGTGTNTTPGNILGGVASGAGSALGLLYGQGAFDKKPKAVGESF